MSRGSRVCTTGDTLQRQRADPAGGPETPRTGAKLVQWHREAAERRHRSQRIALAAIKAAARRRWFAAMAAGYANPRWPPPGRRHVGEARGAHQVDPDLPAATRAPAQAARRPVQVAGPERRESGERCSAESQHVRALHIDGTSVRMGPQHQRSGLGDRVIHDDARALPVKRCCRTPPRRWVDEVTDDRGRRPHPADGARETGCSRRASARWSPAPWIVGCFSGTSRSAATPAHALAAEWRCCQGSARLAGGRARLAGSAHPTRPTAQARPFQRPQRGDRYVCGARTAACNISLRGTSTLFAGGSGVDPSPQTFGLLMVGHRPSRTRGATALASDETGTLVAAGEKPSEGQLGDAAPAPAARWRGVLTLTASSHPSVSARRARRRSPMASCGPGAGMAAPRSPRPLAWAEPVSRCPSATSIRWPSAPVEKESIRGAI